MISASHNPYADNGLKVFGPDGAKLDDAAESEIEARVFALLPSQADGSIDTIPNSKVSVLNSTGWPERYIELLLTRFPAGAWMKGLHVVADCANGALSSVVPEVFHRLGAAITTIHAEPTGTNINDQCGAVHLEALVGAMAASTAQFGVAFDGDGDRAMFVSKSGTVVDGDRTLFTMARRMKQAGLLDPPVVVGTVMTNFGLEKALAGEGIQLTRVSVGDRFIFEEMRKNRAPLGGEPSGHIIFSDFGLSGDGLLTALKVAQVVIEERAPLDAWGNHWAAAPQLLKTVPVARKTSLESAPVLQNALDRARRAIDGRGRVVVRYSGTELALRVMIESDDARVNETLMQDLLAAVQADLA